MTAASTSHGPALAPLGAKAKLDLDKAEPAETDGRTVLSILVHETGLIHPIESSSGTEVRYGEIAWASCGMAEEDFYAEDPEEARAMLLEHAETCSWDNAHSTITQKTYYLAYPDGSVTLHII